MRKFLKLLAAVLIIACGVSAQTSAIWDGTVDTDWYDKNPSANEFIITTAEQLAGLAQLLNNNNSFNGKTIKLGNDIMLNDTTNWQNWGETPPANEWTMIFNFNATFNGNGYVISGVYVSILRDANASGLFGSINTDGVIKNLGLVALHIKSASYSGGLALSNGGTIENCYANGNVFSNGSSGGLVEINGGIIEDCYFIGDVSGYIGSGGLVRQNYGTIKNSYATSDVFSFNGSSGGLVGLNTHSGIIENSYATGNVSAFSHFSHGFDQSNGSGGLVASNNGIIENCYATGNVYAESNSGSYSGGLAGINTHGTIENSHATGNVYAESNFYSYSGGLVGINYSTIENSHATGNVYAESNSNSYSGGLIGNSGFGGRISSCYATGNVYAESYSSSCSGGLVASNNGIIENSHATGNVYASALSSSYYSYSGGLVGRNHGEKTLENCYATGNVFASSRIHSILGGLLGSNCGSTIKNCYATGAVSAIGDNSYSGGLVGENGGYNDGYEYYSGTIINCYATGNVYASGYYSYLGRLVGKNLEIISNSYAAGSAYAFSNLFPSDGLTGNDHYINNETITNSYYDKETGKQTDNNGKGIPKTTIEMKAQTTYDNWDFNNVWEINEGLSYPKLKWSNIIKSTNFEDIYVNWEDKNSFVYNGTSQSPSATAKLANETAVGITAIGAINAGEHIATAKLTMPNEDIGLINIAKQFTIMPKQLPANAIQAIADVHYGGAGVQVTPVIVVRDGTTLLRENHDYTVTDREYKTVGTHTVTINGIGNYTGTTQRQFEITEVIKVNVIWSNTRSFVFNGQEQFPAILRTEPAGYEDLLITEGKQINAGTHTAIAKLATHNDKISLEDPACSYTITAKPLPIIWSEPEPRVFTYNKMVQHPAFTVNTADTVGFAASGVELYAVNANSQAGNYRGISAFRVLLDGIYQTNYQLTSNSANYEILQRPLNVVLKDENGKVKDMVSAELNSTTEEALISYIESVLGYDGFATDTINNQTDDESALRGKPRIVIEPKAPRSLRNTDISEYLVKIETDDISSDNYIIPQRNLNITINRNLVIITADTRDETSIVKPQKSDNRYGIRFTKNIVSDKAEISIILPNNERITETKIIIYDITGNIVYDGRGSNLLPANNAIEWNLTNTAGRNVANGTYLVIAEVKGASGKSYAYSAKLGVKR